MQTSGLTSRLHCQSRAAIGPDREAHNLQVQRPWHGGGPAASAATVIRQIRFQDDDGNNWLPSEGCGLPAGFDHPTVGGGPYAPGATGLLYRDSVYYCAQEEVTALCARSDDGGLTFGASLPIFSPTQCQGSTGHIKVAEDDGVSETGYRVVFKTGPQARQTVFHAHAHVLGGRPLGWPPG